MRIQTAEPRNSSNSGQFGICVCIAAGPVDPDLHRVSKCASRHFRQSFTSLRRFPFFLHVFNRAFRFSSIVFIFSSRFSWNRSRHVSHLYRPGRCFGSLTTGLAANSRDLAASDHNRLRLDKHYCYARQLFRWAHVVKRSLAVFELHRSRMCL